jgi:hypothetical protein
MPDERRREPYVFLCLWPIVHKWRPGPVHKPLCWRLMILPFFEIEGARSNLDRTEAWIQQSNQIIAGYRA